MSTRARKILGRSAILLAIVAALMPAIHSCVFDETRTELCASGRRCPTGWTCAAAQDVCISDGCGNGILEQSVGEVCDDGNIFDNDSCTADCAALVGCGNGRRELGETCDDENNVSGDGCSADCLSEEVCGNDYLDVGEVCDDGNTIGGDGCSTDCKILETCGDSKLQVGEVCDDGNKKSKDGCSKDCLSNEICGNGYRDVDEGCDLGLQDTATCNSNCEVAMCGDGHRNLKFINPVTMKQEQCDSGGDSDECDGDCTWPRCGDGYTNLEFTNPVSKKKEECDDGENGDNSDACVKDCKAATCGDAFVWKDKDESGKDKEECDEGKKNSNKENASCRKNCQLRKCGDGIKDNNFGESCDDGNEENSDGCPDGSGGTCAPARCGDGFIHTGHEQCEPTAASSDCPIGTICVGASLPGECTCQVPAM